MTISDARQVEGRCLCVRGRALLVGVPRNVVVTPLAGESVAFVGVEIGQGLGSRHVFNLGVLQCKICRPQTQMLLLEVRQESALEGGDGTLQNGDDSAHSAVTDGAGFYVLLLPIANGGFRPSLKQTAAAELQLCIESGDTAVQTSQALGCLIISWGDNRDKLLEKAEGLLRGNFDHLKNNKVSAGIELVDFCAVKEKYELALPTSVAVNNQQSEYPLQSAKHVASQRDIATDNFEMHRGVHEDHTDTYDIRVDMSRFLSSQGMRNGPGKQGSDHGSRQQLTRRSKRMSVPSSTSSSSNQPFPPSTQSVTSINNTDHGVPNHEDLESAKAVPEDRNRVWDLQLRLALAMGAAVLILTISAHPHTPFLYVTCSLNALSMASCLICCILIALAVNGAGDRQTPSVSCWVWWLIIFMVVCFLGSFGITLLDKLKRGNQQLP